MVLFKNRKCIAALLLCLCLLSGCFGNANRYDEEAIAKYQAIIQESNAMTGTGFEAIISIYKGADRKQKIGKMNFYGELLLSADDVQMRLDAKFSFSGISLDQIHLYYQDQTMYLDMMDTKIKQPLPDNGKGQSPEELLKQSRKQSDEEDIKAMFTEMIFADDSKHVIIALIDPDVIFEQLKQAEFDENLSIEHAELVMTEENGTWKEVSLRMEAEAEEETIAVDVDFCFTDTNAVDHIDFPDFSDYLQNDDMTTVEDDDYEGMEAAL